MKIALTFLTVRAFGRASERVSIIVRHHPTHGRSAHSTFCYRSEPQ
jgi:hypothetical protein